MNKEQQEAFKKEFKSIVYQYSLLQKNKQYLKKLHAFDKNGSHEKAILKAVSEREEIRDKLDKMLKGVKYSEWLKFSKKLTKLNSRLNNHLSKIKEIEEELEFLLWDEY